MSHAEYDDNPFADPSVSYASASKPVAPSYAPKQPTDTPAWLQETEPMIAPPPPTRSWETPNPAPVPSAQQTVNPAVPKFVLYTRIGNALLATGMVIAGILGLLSASVTTGVIACYVIAFSCLICCYETHLKQIHKTIVSNFGFLYNAKTRIIFFLFVGMLLFNLGILGYIFGSFMMVNIVFHIYLLIMYPEFEDFQREDAQKEIQDYLAAHPELSDQAIRAGLGFARENPDLVKKGAEAYFHNQSKSSNSYRPPSAYP